MRACQAADLWRTECRVIDSLGFHSGRVLDVGCNQGVFLESMGEDWEKHGVELARPLADIARGKGIRVYDQPVEDCRFPDSFFDVITMYALIEHLRDPRLVINEISQALRPGGLLVIMTGARNSLKARCKGQSWHMYCPPIHLWFFTHRSLVLLIEQFGFKETSSRYTSGTMPWYISGCLAGKALDFVEKQVVKRLFEHPPLWRVPLYDHLYLYALKEVHPHTLTHSEHR